ncbi:unnamed protein product, partial [Urochloa humidicola]
AEQHCRSFILAAARTLALCYKSLYRSSPFPIRRRSLPLFLASSTTRASRRKQREGEGGKQRRRGGPTGAAAATPFASTTTPASRRWRRRSRARTSPTNSSSRSMRRTELPSPMRWTRRWGQRRRRSAAAVDDHDTNAVHEPAQLQPDTAASSPCATKPRRPTHGSSEDPDFFDDVDYNEEKDKEDTQVSTPILLS